MDVSSLIHRPRDYESVYLPLCKVAVTPFHIEGGGGGDISYKHAYKCLPLNIHYSNNQVFVSNLSVTRSGASFTVYDSFSEEKKAVW